MDSSVKKIAVVTDAPFCLYARIRRIAEILVGGDASVMIYAQGFLIEQSQAVTPEGMTLVTSSIPSGGIRKLAWHATNRLLPFTAYKKRNRELTKALLDFQPDIIHCVNVFNLEACVEVTRRLGCKMIYEASEYWPEHLFADQYGLSNSYASHLASVERDVAPRIDRFITVSEPFAEWYQSEVGMSSAQVVLNASMPQGDIVFRSDTGVDSGTLIRAVHSGNVMHNRNIDSAVRAIEQVDQVELTVIGSGAALPELIQLVSQLKLEDEVKFRKPVPHSEVIEMLSRYDVGLQLSDAQTRQTDGTIPNKLFDYFAAGLASIVVSTQGVRALEGIEDAALLIEDSKPETVADALRTLHDDRALLVHLQEHALLMSERYSRDKQMNQIKAIYEEFGVVFS